MVQTTVSGLPTIGDVILAWRKFRGLRSIELVKKAGIKKGYLSAVEHNKRANPQEEYLVKLADALGVPLQDIYGRRMPPEKREDGEAEEEDQTYDMVNSALAPTESPTEKLLDNAYERIKAIIESKHYSKEEAERFVSGLVAAAELLSKVIKPQYRSNKRVRP